MRVEMSECALSHRFVEALPSEVEEVCEQPQAVEPLGRGRRVVIVAPTLDILGGQGVQAQSLYEHLQAEGYEVSLLPINPSFPPRLRFLRRYRYVRTIVNQLLFVPSLARLRRAEVVHVFSAAYWAFLLAPVPTMIISRLLRKRTLLHYHSGEAQDHLMRWGLRVHPWLRLAHEIVVPSEYLREVFSSNGYCVQVVRNVIALDRFRFRERTPLRPRLLCTRNLEPHYGVDVVIRAFALVRTRFPEATLCIVGYGSESTRLKRLAASIAPDQIQFLGRVEPAQIPGVYDRSDIFLNGALIDNQPVSVLEAFACGLPVVSTNVGDLPNMLEEGAAGCLVPPGDALAMAAAVIGLLKDPLHAMKLGRRARDLAAEYCWGSVRWQWAALYGRSAA